MSDLILGALLAIIGGAISDEFRAWRERRNERKAIKTSLVDELSEIEMTVKNMHEVWDQTHVFGVKYITDLLSCTSAYDSCRQRLFLIKDTELRKEIIAFYKKLKNTAQKAEGKVGSLDETQESKDEQSGFERSFQEIGAEAKVLREKLEK